MNMRKGILLLALGFFMSVNVQAQSQDSLNISLQKAIDIALENNYQLKVAENNVELSKKEVLSNKADYLPSVDANLSGNRNIGRTLNQNRSEERRVGKE